MYYLTKILEDKMAETWVDIKGYEGHYQISNLGRVKSLSRTIYDGLGRARRIKEKIRQANGKFNYWTICLSKDNKSKVILIHQLVWDYFGDRPRKSRLLQVDHIDGNKQNNHISNLQLLSTRDNTLKGYAQRGKELPAGVTWNKNARKYIAQIKINGGVKYLGRYSDPLSANQAYQEARKSLCTI